MNCNKVNKNINVRHNDSSTKSIMKKIHDKLQSISQGEALIGLRDMVFNTTVKIAFPDHM